MAEIDKRFAFVFEGQGSQRPGMYVDLFTLGSPAVHRILDTADQFCRKRGLPRIVDVCSGTDPLKSLLIGENFDPISVQLAIVTGEVATVAYLHEQGVPDAYVNAGQSLGQIAAAVGSRFFHYDRALPATVVRAQIMGKASRVKETANGLIYDIRRGEQNLAVVVQERLDQFRQEGDDGAITLLNHQYQIIVGGTRRHIERVINAFRESHPGIRAELYPNAQLSHHKRLSEGQSVFNRVLRSVRSGLEEKIPLLVDATNQIARTLSEFKRGIAGQLKNPLNWNSSMESLYEMGLTTWVEIGPGKIFGSMAKMASLDVEVLPTPTVEMMEVVISRFALPTTSYLIPQSRVASINQG